MISLKLILTNNKVLKNFSVLTLSNAITQLLLIFTSIKIARSLDPTLFGTYNLLNLHVYIVAVIASFGLRNIIIRSIARDKSIIKKVFSIALIIRGIGLVLSIILFCIYSLLYKHYDNLLFLLVIICIISTSIFDLFESLAFGLEKMEFSGVINLISTTFWLFTVMIIPANHLSLHLIYGLFVLFSTLKTAVYFFSIYRGNYIKGLNFENIDKIQIFQFSKECTPYYYLAFFTLLSNQIPILFLEYRSGVEQIGFFNIASKILMPLNLLLTTILASIFPFLSRLFTSDYKSFIKNVRLIFTIIALFSIAFAFGVTLFRYEVIHLLYGEKYFNSSLVLGYQGWYLAIYSVVCLIGTILGAINRQKELSYLSIVCTVIQVPILWFGSKYGAQYLSAAFLFATAITLVIHLFVINSFLKNDLSFIFYLKISAIYIIGYVISIFIPVGIAFWYKAIIYSVISLAGSYFIFRKYQDNLRKIFVH